MAEHLANFTFQNPKNTEIKVIGVGGGGGNAVNYMFKLGIRDVDFVICNTDAQALNASPVINRVQLGASLTEGRGAGNKPEVGREAALENIEDVKKTLENNTKMVFITAGMGGGTGTGGAPVIAKACKEAGYLTVGIVTIPFRNEGRRRIKQAAEGIAEMEHYVDSLLIINNERIREMYGDFGISEAFSKADNVLATAAKGIAEIITVPGYINVDFADVETVMRNSGLAIMGTGIAKGENRAEDALNLALNSPLLNNNDIRGAKNILLNITSGTQEATMDEVGRITDFVQNRAGFDADLIWGNGKDETFADELSVTIIATGFSHSAIPGYYDASEKEAKQKFDLEQMKAETEYVQESKSVEKKKDVSVKQRFIEFDIDKERQKEEDDFEALYPGTSRKRNNKISKSYDGDFNTISDEDVENLENIPAYQRKNLRMNDPQLKKKFSFFSVTSENKISDKNSYLHGQVD
ncbi:MAG: cell division protein FtsZ [Prolixibacteraceae bacterium]|nr:cell division protein FtsZ [Prolixibacteraceae bacterium]